jgi:hypothetical protein
LGDRNERDRVRIKNLDDLGEVGEGAGQTVDLVDGRDVDFLATMSTSRRFNAGRSMFPPENPGSS